MRAAWRASRRCHWAASAATSSESGMADSFDLGFIGGGNMAEGIIAAVVRGGLYAPGRIIVADPVEARRGALSSRFGVAVTEANAEVLRQAGRVVLAVKPQSFAEMASAAHGVVGDGHLLVSIMAGVSTRKIEEAFSPAKARVVRVMPNLPIHVGAGIAGICAGRHASRDDVAAVRAIFDAGGGSVVLDDEGLMDAVTAVSGSGPAYFYAFVEAMIAGGVACGLSEADALKLAAYACLGAAKMMLETGEVPAELRRKVTSKGGTTQAALEHMASKGVPEAIRGGVEAAFRRGRELGG